MSLILSGGLVRRTPVVRNREDSDAEDPGGAIRGRRCVLEDHRRNLISSLGLMQQKLVTLWNSSFLSEFLRVEEEDEEEGG